MRSHRWRRLNASSSKDRLERAIGRYEGGLFRRFDIAFALFP